MTTPIQNIKALTAIANDGVLLQPYIVDKIVDGSTGEVTYQGERTELGQVASSSTVTKMKQLMHDVVDFGTGSIYAMEGYDLIAKTGTAQIASTDGSGYLTGEYDVIRGFAGIYPAENPKLIIYATMTRPQSKSARPLSMIIDQIIVNATQYYGIDTTVDDNEVVDPVVENLMPSFINQTINNATTTLTEMGVTPYVLGNGTKVVSQYPAEGTTITNKEKVFLVTNDDTTIAMPNITGWSLKEVKAFANLLKIPLTVTGNGYVTSQSIPEGTILNQDSMLTVTLEVKFQSSA
ncbi:MAG TPA: PASTA domain-containing protein [Candidatus Faecenecus gallistercoris]|uniref:PASTA domain-containing protein n=1 Tax=Candidatus Faecenecus gallistercoris TaxID=2840793 RepID=A0A9D0Z0H7_9FIRM|nr:PASTA domain-containing protein [Candidatus Faecenecus gallistercoris]